MFSVPFSYFTQKLDDGFVSETKKNTIEKITFPVSDLPFYSLLLLELRVRREVSELFQVHIYEAVCILTQNKAGTSKAGKR